MKSSLKAGPPRRSRGPEKLGKITITMPTAMIDDLKGLADQEHRSLSNLITIKLRPVVNGSI